MSRIDDLRALAEKATPGPWSQGHGAALRHVKSNADLYAGTTVATVNYTSQNAAFIAEWRNAAPAILAVLEAVKRLDDHEHGDADTLTTQELVYALLREWATLESGAS